MLSIIISTLALGFIVLKLVKWLVDYVRLCSIVNKIPGPPMLPLLGNALSFSADAFIHDLVAVSKRFADRSFFRLWIGTHFWIVLHKPEHLEVVFNESTFSGKAFEYDFLIPWIGKGLITSKGTKWQTRRRLISPTFSIDILNDFLSVFNDQSNILIDILKENLKNSKSEFDIIPFVSNCTLDILCETVMGINVNAQGSKHSKYVDAVLKIGPILFQRPVNPLYWPNFVWERTKLGRDYNEHLKNLHEFTRKVIEERDAEYEAGETATKKKQKIAFLDLLLKVKREQNQIDLVGIKEEVDTFMFAGHDTSANTLAWTIYLVGSHPNVQAKLQAEVDNVFGNSNRNLTSQDLNELKYLECVINESLRLFPPAPFLGRSIGEDCEIDGYKIPKGGTAIILTYMLHRDERYFPNPDEFIPERFSSPTLKDNLPTYSYIPFSTGPRFCIGKKFAQNSLKVILAHLLRHFHIESMHKAGELRGAMDLLLRPEHGVFIRLKERF